MQLTGAGAEVSEDGHGGAPALQRVLRQEGQHPHAEPQPAAVASQAHDQACKRGSQPCMCMKAQRPRGRVGAAGRGGHGQHPRTTTGVQEAGLAVDSPTPAAMDAFSSSVRSCGRCGKLKLGACCEGRCPCWVAALGAPGGVEGQQSLLRQGSQKQLPDTTEGVCLRAFLISHAPAWPASPCPTPAAGGRWRAPARQAPRWPGCAGGRWLPPGCACWHPAHDQRH